MDDSQTTSLEQIRAFLAGSSEVRFAGQGRDEVYRWMEQTLVRHQYSKLERPEKGLLRCYLARLTVFDVKTMPERIAAATGAGAV